MKSDITQSLTGKSLFLLSLTTRKARNKILHHFPNYLYHIPLLREPACSQLLLLTSKQPGSHTAATYDITPFFKSHLPLVCSSACSQFGKCWGSSNIYETAGVTCTGSERLRHKHSNHLSVLTVNTVNLEILTTLIKPFNYITHMQFNLVAPPPLLG